MMKTVKFFTLGCKVNQYETQSIREAFLQKGFKDGCVALPASICVINTCTVTQTADQKSKAMVHRAAQENPRATIIVTGCLAEKDSVSLRRMKEIDYVIGKRFFPEGVSSFTGHTRAFLKIQDGCNNMCSYCKVPVVRGGSRSRSLASIMKDACCLAENGFKEIVLSGICLGAYGRDLKPPLTLVDVINALENLNGLSRIRLSSIEIKDVSDQLIAKMISSRKLCRHLHIPLQSGDDEVLRNMNRRYTRGFFLKRIREIKKAVQGVAITTDVLVGFPGETGRHFQNTVDALEKIVPLRTHIFPFSPRKNTPAFGMENELDQKTLAKRIEALKSKAEKSSQTYRKQFLNNTLFVLIEEHDQENPRIWQGYSDNYIRVKCSSKKDLKNTLIPLRMKGMRGNYMLANSA